MRKKLMEFFLGLLLSLIPFAALAVHICDTHEFCTVGLACGCTVNPSGAFDRFFYFDISVFKPKHFYRCDLSDGPSSLSINLSGSVFPVGTKVTCQGSCPHFPLTLFIDTQAMSGPLEAVMLKYYVPASDIPDKVSLYCHERSSQNWL